MNAKLLKSLKDVVTLLPSEFFTDNMLDILQTALSEQKRENEEIRVKNQQKQQNFENMVKNATTFEFCIVFKEKQIDGTFNDYFEVEGIKNALIIFDQYRKIGFKIGIHSMSINLGSTLVKKLNFKY